MGLSKNESFFGYFKRSQIADEPRNRQYSGIQFVEVDKEPGEDGEDAGKEYIPCFTAGQDPMTGSKYDF